MNRNDTSREPLGIYKNWKILMFENLTGKHSDLTEEILNYSLFQILNTQSIIDYDDLVPEIVEKALNTLRYESYLCDRKIIHDHFSTIQQLLNENDELKSLFKKKVCKSIEINLKLKQEK